MNLELWKQRKKDLKLKYEDISEKSGIPITTVKYIFCGYVTAPRVDTVEAIERVLGLGISPEERAAGATETIKKSVTPKEDELLYLFRCLSDPLQDSLLNVARTLSGQPGESNLHKKA